VVRRRGRLAGAAVVLAMTLSACGSSASPSIAPSGVDELVVPTPDPDPADFVAAVDNPWFPLEPGRTWTYEESGAVDGTVSVRVLDDPAEVAGVATTAVERTEPDGTSYVDRFAQDRRGNVWWFARDGVWRAGEDGAQAGLAVPATPRLGDGWRAAYGAGQVDVRVTVAAVGESVTTPAGRFEGLVALDVTDALGGAEPTRAYLARGTGLVEQVSLEGPVSVLELSGASD
jgi:hypothetical protein